MLNSIHRVFQHTKKLSKAKELLQIQHFQHFRTSLETLSQMPESRV